MILGSQTWDPDPETPCGTGMSSLVFRRRVTG